MKILITGVSGQLGKAISAEYAKLKHQTFGISSYDVDITNEVSVKKAIIDFRPDVVFHCAAYTAVDKAETDSERCFDVNANGTANVAKYVREVDAKLVYISTDYVFDGKLDRPYETTDSPYPINVYGTSKLKGEELACRYVSKCFIVRTSWLFGEGVNFIRKISHAAQNKSQIEVVTNQFGSPTYAHDLAQFLIKMVNTEHYGIYHATNTGFCSWYDMAVQILSEGDIHIPIIPINCLLYPSIASRPQNSRLSKQSIVDNGFELLPDWKDAIKRYLTLNQI